MRIAEVVATPLRTHAVFVRVVAEDGRFGIGECYPIRSDWGARWLADFVANGLGPKLVGQDATRIDPLWHLMYFSTVPRQGDKGAMLAGIAAVDVALWDLAGKLQERPVAALLGGAAHDRIPMYASVGGGDAMSPEEMVRAVDGFAQRGFRAFKIRMHWGTHRVDVDPAKDVAMFRAVRRHLGDGVPLAFDANNGYSTKTAIRQGRLMEEDGLWHFEEPVAHHDYEGLARVADALAAPVAAGEQEYTRWQFHDLVERARVDIVQPDVLKCGGISELRKILVYADIRNRLFVPHQNQATIGLAATLHVVATAATALRPQEYLGPQPELEALFDRRLEPSEGFLEVPEGPGLGLELDLERLQAAAL